MASPRLDYDTLQHEITDLRRDFSTLLETLRGQGNGVAKDAEHTIRDLASQAERIYTDLSRSSRDSLHAVGKSIEERPLVSILIAFVLGFIGSRLLDRR
jgi:ElaB/YqjD/DUF883 family membrane-anchored ribosome-binding protein